jgi:hypothetical protein
MIAFKKVNLRPKRREKKGGKKKIIINVCVCVQLVKKYYPIFTNKITGVNFNCSHEVT